MGVGGGEVAVGRGVRVGGVSVAVGTGVFDGVFVGAGVFVGMSVGTGVSVGESVGIGVSAVMFLGTGVSAGMSVGTGVSVSVVTGASVAGAGAERRAGQNAGTGGYVGVYGPRWWSALHSLGAEDTIVFDFETTGIEKHLDEAVSIAVQSYASPSGGPVKYNSLIAPRFPGKLLERNAKGECAYDIHGIHPDDLAGQPPFQIVHGTLWEIMWEKNWVCWDADFDVGLLDSLCLRHGLPLIPRKRVVCAMKLLSPLAGKWDAGRSAYRKAKLEEMAQAMGCSGPEKLDT